MADDVYRVHERSLSETHKPATLKNHKAGSSGPGLPFHTCPPQQRELPAERRGTDQADQDACFEGETIFE
ncbi:hypothetical protein [Streptomyces sp. MK7]|uniref:hypothetical protein n=1 Tax=Streptomyces sp. MK7 TaxID=3067635 RepID=UPI00292DBD24|nr:hypothetical protein [Streptomyces sp. MK7]